MARRKWRCSSVSSECWSAVGMVVMFLPRRLVDRNDRSSAEADVVLQSDLGAVDLALVGLAAQLPGELRALGEPGGAERMALGDQASGRVDHRALAAVGGRLGLDQLVALALGREAERLVADQLVGRGAVVELDHV